jgi:hypothetical protein
VSFVDVSRAEEGVNEAALLAFGRVRQAWVDRLQSRCSRRTGALSAECDTGTTDPVQAGTGVEFTSSIDLGYARYQDEGTGVFGPEGTRITPVSSSVLVFDWPAAGGVVFARSVAGAPGTHFWTLAVGEWPDIVASAGG